MQPQQAAPTPKRIVLCKDAISWLRQQQELDTVMTSMPDVSEIKGLTLETWRKWFIDAATLIFTKLKNGSFAVFYQTDVKVISSNNTYRYIDKAFLVQVAAESVPGIRLLWRKIFTLSDSKQIITHNKAPFSHLLCFRKDEEGNLVDPMDRIPDVSSMGEKLWTRGMGFNATLLAMKFLVSGGAKCVYDPFCGKGSVLAVANYLGLDAVGVEIAASRARKAEALQVSEEIGFRAMAWLASKQSTPRRGEEKKEESVQNDIDEQLDGLFNEES